MISITIATQRVIFLEVRSRDLNDHASSDGIPTVSARDPPQRLAVFEELETDGPLTLHLYQCNLGGRVEGYYRPRVKITLFSVLNVVQYNNNWHIKNDVYEHIAGNNGLQKRCIVSTLRRCVFLWRTMIGHNSGVKTPM